MNTYLAIITTILVITQIIRVTQNAISLHRQNVLFEKQCEEVRDIEIMKEDFEVQRKAYKLIVAYFENKAGGKE
ncbi:MAG: hypothetical protein KBT03_04830 [Bacteroidales bacterium]|nr:hypothetical protein [Candidatus Scybalousia scybalohippi]